MAGNEEITGDSPSALYIKKVAAKRNWAVNNDIQFTGKIAAGLAVNRERYGYFGCPCRDNDGDHEVDKDIICPCVYAAADIQEYGHCYCGLFLTHAFAAGGQRPKNIPERRPEQ